MKDQDIQKIWDALPADFNFRGRENFVWQKLRRSYATTLDEFCRLPAAELAAIARTSKDALWILSDMQQALSAKCAPVSGAGFVAGELAKVVRSLEDIILSLKNRPKEMEELTL